MSMLRNLLPESIFGRKLPADVEQRLLFAQARAEEAIVRAHVENALLFVDALAPDLSFDRALDVYVREMSVTEPLASVVVTRALVALGEGVISLRPAIAARHAEAVSVSEGLEEIPSRPKLRLDDATAARRRLA